MRCVDVPRDISKSLPVLGQVEGLPLKSTLSGGGSYRLHLHSNIWRKLRIGAGDTVEVTRRRDPFLTCGVSAAGKENKKNDYEANGQELPLSSPILIRRSEIFYSGRL